jgi:hypothetical protein
VPPGPCTVACAPGLSKSSGRGACTAFYLCLHFEVIKLPRLVLSCVCQEILEFYQKDLEFSSLQRHDLTSGFLLPGRRVRVDMAAGGAGGAVQGVRSWVVWGVARRRAVHGLRGAQARAAAVQDRGAGSRPACVWVPKPRGGTYSVRPLTRTPTYCGSNLQLGCGSSLDQPSFCI